MPDVPELETRPLAAAGSDGWLLAGRYRMLDRVGVGGMAEVFRAHDELLDRDVAVKVFRTLLDDPDSAVNAESRRELELQAMARLNHPSLVTLYDGSVQGDGPPFLVLEYVPGPNLAARLRQGALPEPAVRALGEQVAAGLAYVHSQGLVHRDVKPANILLNEVDGRARLSDFGVVRMIGRPQMTSADLTIGTAYYLAPEQARGSAVGPEADVYALGLVLLEALTGRRCFDGPLAETLATRLTTDPVIPAELPDPWPGMLAAMTARNPAARPSAAAVAAQLAGGDLTAAVPPFVSAALPAAAVPDFAVSEPVPAAATRHRGRLGLIAAGLAAAVVALLAFSINYLLPADSHAPAGTTPTTVATTGSTGTRPVTTVRHHSGVPAAAVVPENGTATKSKHPARHHHEPPAGTGPSRAPAGAPASAGPTQTSSSPAAASSSAPASDPAPSSSAPPTDPAPGGTAGAQGEPSTTPPGP